MGGRTDWILLRKLVLDRIVALIQFYHSYDHGLGTIAGLELSGEGGLRLVGWLETEQGVTWPLNEPGDCLVIFMKLNLCMDEALWCY